MPAHVIDDDVGDDVDAGRVAPLDHVNELVAGSRPGFQLVGDWLVPGPPLGALDMFIGRRNLRKMEFPKTKA